MKLANWGQYIFFNAHIHRKGIIIKFAKIIGWDLFETKTMPLTVIIFKLSRNFNIH